MTINLIRLTRGAIDGVLSALGYTLVSRRHCRYGFSLHADLRRLCAERRLDITCIFDVGANHGQFANQMLHEFPAARIHAFEPFATSYELLRSKCVAPARLTAMQVALTDACGTSPLYIYGDKNEGSMLNSLAPDAQFPTKFGYEARTIEVPTSTVDTYCSEAEIEFIDLLKIDTEGTELEVVQGASGMLAAGKIRFVYLEFNTLTPRPGQTGGALLPIAKQLEEFGYEYLVCYTDYVSLDGVMHVCANALFARLT